MLIDSHCHLDYPGLAEEQEAVLARARAVGVSAMLNISTKESDWDRVIATAEREPDVWSAIGIHPHEADTHAHIDTDRLVAAAAHPRVIGIGESGLDFFYDHSDRTTQIVNFRRHIAAARETGLPLIIHSRDAEAETVAILAEEKGRGDFPALIHCFTGSAGFAEQVLDLGLFISLSGIVTFKNAKALQQVAVTVPGNRLLVETDAPFLAPVPHRGRKGEPAFVADTVRFLATLRQVPAEELMATTALNFMGLFTKLPPCA